jgi:acetyl-CoA synthetase (ADP-forming)
MIARLYASIKFGDARIDEDPVTTLSEAESKALLSRYGVPVAPERLATTPDEAAEAADALGYPVVAKLCGATIAHKTERGLVRLGLGSADAVRAAAADLLAAARPDDGEVSVLVGSMVRGSRELIAGVVQDPQFGHCVMVGIGGIFAEALADVAFRVVPFGAVDAEDMVEDLQHQSLLGPFRGEPPVDRHALVSVLEGLARLTQERSDVVSVDVNPLIVVDGMPVAVDALVELGS